MFTSLSISYDKKKDRARSLCRKEFNYKIWPKKKIWWKKNRSRGAHSTCKESTDRMNTWIDIFMQAADEPWVRCDAFVWIWRTHEPFSRTKINWEDMWVARPVLLASLLGLRSKLQSEMNANGIDLIRHGFSDLPTSPTAMNGISSHTNFIFFSFIFKFCATIPFVYKWKKFGFTVDLVVPSVPVVAVVFVRQQTMTCGERHGRCHFTSNLLWLLDAC